MNSFIGQEIGALSNPYFCDIRNARWSDLTAGDGIIPKNEDTGRPWYKDCSPGLLAYHARWPAFNRPVHVDLYEIQEATYDRLLTTLERELPKIPLPRGYSYRQDMVYRQVDANRWTADSDRIQLCAYNRSGHTASLDDVDAKTAVLISNDPNSIATWAMPPELTEELVNKKRVGLFRAISTMGCNVGGLKMLPLDLPAESEKVKTIKTERRQWYELLRIQQRVLPVYRDLVLYALHRDSDRWAYLVGEPIDWVEKSRQGAIRSAEKQGMTVYSASWRRNPALYARIVDYLFLTEQEPVWEAIR